jgi:hypothetical protein
MTGTTGGYFGTAIGRVTTPIFAELDQQFIHVVLRKVFTTPFLVIGGLARDDGEKAQSLDWP